ncbi:MAG: hypothetical protein QOF55_797 [Thermoleophilaceae bacterium]|jgi:hypothetical protein|nr:hypothetical protein [Thermoleophilaceae bacterium]
MRPFLPLAIVPALLLAPAAGAKPEKDLWATVNVCDTAKSPDQMGVRARMPGDGTRRKMYMRFTAQYLASGKWKVVAGRGRSAWLYAGSALFRNQELGYTFSFDAPKAGSGYTMRGLVQFEWRAKGSGKVVRRTHRLTERGHPTKPAEPPRFSAASCKISTPKAPATGP